MTSAPSKSAAAGFLEAKDVEQGLYDINGIDGTLIRRSTQGRVVHFGLDP
jgi:hypothetical protein